MNKKVFIGQQLRRVREERGLTYDDVYDKIRVHQKVLQKLEEDNYDASLGPVYAKVFLRRYAKFLGLDEARIIAEYESLYENKDIRNDKSSIAIEKHTSFPPDTSSSEKFAFIKPLVAVLILLLIGFGFIKSIFFIIGKFRNRETKVVEVVVEQEQVQELNSPVEKVIDVPVVKEPSKKKVRRSEIPKTLTADISQEEKLTLMVTASDFVWFQLKVDGKVMFQSVMPEGESETWEADESFKIWTGRAEALNITLNGTDLGTPGKGVMRNIMITRKGFGEEN
ncbi:MAG: RodZ domain-containing protein [Candidatus Omnitrophota bacterium]